MFGDLAVAVNPEDTRFKDKIGKNVILPIVGRKIPIIEDSYVDMEYGTGCVKITPSHDPNDFEVGARHKLGQCVVIDTKGHITDEYGKYSGLDRYEARKQIIEQLEDEGYLEKIETLTHAVGYSERTNVVIEPLISKQWFVKMDELAKMAADVYQDGELQLIPDSLGKTYMNWLNNIRDWTISRQLWWGHRLPVFYTDDGEIIVSEDDPDEEGKLNGVHVTQEEDTLDTWFSSALWPFATLGWPNENKKLDYFFPTDILVTGYDIIFFWVIRMVFSSLYTTGKVPFDHVLFTGLIRDPQGRKMSKSLGNGVDPIDVVNEYGADALRFTLITGNSPGNDMRYDEKRIIASRNFANKLWNATRFVLMNIEKGDNLDFSTVENLALEDKWILKRLNNVIEEVTKNLEKYEIGLAASRIENFIWEEYCDWYIEFAKLRLYGEDKKAKADVKKVLLYVLNKMIALLHPFMPFITEEIYSALPDKKDMLIVEDWPIFNEEFEFISEEATVNSAIEAITAIRNQRATLNVGAKTKQDLIILAENEEYKDLLENLKGQFKNLANSNEVDIYLKDEFDKDKENLVNLVFNEFSVLMSLDDLMDYEQERKRLNEEIKRLECEIKRASGKLNNENFVNKAPEAVVNEEREKLANYEDLLEKTKLSLEEIKDK